MKHLLVVISVVAFVAGCRQETSRMPNYEVQGIDVSHHQSYVNWDSVASAAITFAFVKATEGATLNDSLYCHNWAEMKRVGLKRGAYHFFRPTIAPVEQARNFARLVELDYGDLPPVLDVEVMDGVSKFALISRMRTWLAFVEARYGIKPVIYTNLKFYNRYLAGHFDEFPVWIARYNTREPRMACGREWQFWQYGNRGHLKGVNGNVDLNVFNGTAGDLEMMCLRPSPALSDVAVETELENSPAR